MHPALQFFLPFQWAGFEVRPLFTYWLPLKQPADTVEQPFAGSIRRDLDKARKAAFEIVAEAEPHTLLQLARRANKLTQAEEQTFRKTWQALQPHRQTLLLTARTPNGKPAASTAFVFDNRRVVFYGSAIAPDFRQSGALSLLIADVIRQCTGSGHCDIFDFEGSMIPGVEQYFRGFNPEPQLYLNVRKYKFPALARLYRQF